MDKRANFLAQPDEMGTGADRPPIPVSNKFTHKANIVTRHNAPGTRRHDNKMCAQRQSLINRMGDQKNCFAGFCPNRNQQFLHLLTREAIELFVNSKDVPERELRSALSDALGKVDQKIVVFQGDRKVLLGDMVRILNIAKAAGAEQIAIAAKRVTGAQMENNPSGGGSP